MEEVVEEAMITVVMTMETTTRRRRGTPNMISALVLHLRATKRRKIKRRRRTNTQESYENFVKS
eukprot:2482696-Amphidinium_carterae.1